MSFGDVVVGVEILHGLLSRHAPAPPVPPPPQADVTPDEVVVEVANDTPRRAIERLERRHHAVEEDAYASDLAGDSFLLLRVAPRGSIEAEAARFAAEPIVRSAQPNYLFSLQAGPARQKPSATPMQYALTALRLPQAHALAKGDQVLVGMIDSAVDESQPELAGAIVRSYDPRGGAVGSADHGTAVAGLIAAHGRLVGAAPAARILAARAFLSSEPQDRAATYAIQKSLDWLVANHVRVVNMSFAGPYDPDLHRRFAEAAARGVTLIAAAGNGGPTSPPLYPGADPAVIAVSATDRDDGLFAGANRGNYIQVAAPGVDVLVAAPNGAYQMLSGTSISAAEVSGVAALMLQRKPDLTPAALRALLVSTARASGAGQDGPKVVDAYRATLSVAPPPARRARAARRR